MHIHAIPFGKMNIYKAKYFFFNTRQKSLFRGKNIFPVRKKNFPSWEKNQGVYRCRIRCRNFLTKWKILFLYIYAKARFCSFNRKSKKAPWK